MISLYEMYKNIYIYIFKYICGSGAHKQHRYKAKHRMGQNINLSVMKKSLDINIMSHEDIFYILDHKNTFGSLICIAKNLI